MRGEIRSALLSAAAVCLILTLYVPVTSAENLPGSFTGSLFAGRARFDSDLHYLNESFRGAAIGYDFTRNLSAELSYSFMRTKEGTVPGSDVNADVDIIRAEALYHLPRIKSDLVIVPFLAAGGGTFVFNSKRGGSSADPDIAVDYGLGIKWFFVHDLALRADIRHAIGFKKIDDTYNVLLYYFGLTYQRRERETAAAPVEAPVPPKEIAPAPPAPPADSDGDGIPDDIDKCPGTPAGVAVDKDGCPRDSDGDGVPDYLDKCPGTPSGTKVDANGCPPPAKATMTQQGSYYFGKIYFDFNKTAIRPESRPVLQNVIEYMDENPEVRLEVQGHADIIGPQGYNLQLSESRAKAVKKYLVSKGITAERLSTKGFGVSRPVAPNKTKAGRAKNRRIEFMPIQYEQPSGF